MSLARLGSSFLVLLAVYQISWNTRCGYENHNDIVSTMHQNSRAEFQQSAVACRQQLDSVIDGVQRESSAAASSSRIRRVPLYDLVDTKKEFSCPKNLVLVNDTRHYDTHKHTTSPNNGARGQQSIIPRIIHVTAKSRCLTPAFAANLELWKARFPNHTFVLHNDEAMDRLLFDRASSKSGEFPHLSQIASACLHTAAGKADLWRALVLYEYGGIYTDIDNAPGAMFNSSTIAHAHSDSDSEHYQAFFVVENEGMLSQYFMASAPRHSLLYLLIQTTLQRLLQVPSVENQYVPFVTGPGALKAAFVEFMQVQHLQPNNKKNKPEPDGENIHSNNDTAKDDNKYVTFQKVRAGHYTGIANWTVTVVGSARTGSQEYVERNVIYQKRRIYQEMGMTHFSRVHQRKKEFEDYNPHESCLQRMYRMQQQTA